MTAKFTMTVAVTATLPLFLIEISQVPDVVAVTEADNESSPACKDTTTTSFTPIAVLLKVKLIASLAGYVWLTQVITPEGAGIALGGSLSSTVVTPAVIGEAES